MITGQDLVTRLKVERAQHGVHTVGCGRDEGEVGRVGGAEESREARTGLIVERFEFLNHESNGLVLQHVAQLGLTIEHDVRARAETAVVQERRTLVEAGPVARERGVLRRGWHGRVVETMLNPLSHGDSGAGLAEGPEQRVQVGEIGVAVAVDVAGIALAKRTEQDVEVGQVDLTVAGDITAGRQRLTDGADPSTRRRSERSFGSSMVVKNGDEPRSSGLMSSE